MGLNSNEWDWFIEIMVVRLHDRVEINVVMKIVMFCDRVLNHRI